MLGHILLLCDEVERPFLTDTLRAHAPDLDIRHVLDGAALAAVEPPVLRDARLVGFNAEVALPPAAMAALGHGAYNFHGGSPAYPGWMPAAFAAYDGAVEFGAVAHELSARGDGGAIVGVDTFPVSPDATRAILARHAYLAMLGLFRRLALALATRPSPLPTLPLAWGPRRATRALFADLCDIPATIDKDELQRRLRGFGDGDGHSVPTVWLHGAQFRYGAPNG